MKHLSDEEIQDFLDGNLPERNQEIERHLSECESCRVEVKHYRRLAAALAADTGQDLAAGFADRVMVRVSAEPVARPRAVLFERLAMALVGAAMVVVAAVFLDWSLVGRVLVEMFSRAATKASATAPEVTGGMHIDLNLLAAALTVLALIGIADHFILKPLRDPAGHRRGHHITHHSLI